MNKTSPDFTNANITDAERQILTQIDNAAMLTQVQNWCAINSGTGNLNGLAHMADMLKTAFSALPGTVELVSPDSVENVTKDGSIQKIKRGDHLVVSVRPEANLRVLLTGHMDTVFPKDSHFQTLKWLEDGILNGPGVADMKGGISVILHALLAFEQNEYASVLGYDILINSDEEVGSGSSAELIKKLADGKLAALTFEPALPDGTLAGARGGSGNFSIIFTGKSAHAGRNPDDGRNAIVAAADMAVQLKKLSRKGLSVNPAKIEGGGANNVVPDHAILRVNFRPKTPELEAFADQELEKLCNNLAREHDLSIHKHGGFGQPPKPVDDQAEKLFELVKKCGKMLNIDISWRSTGGVCDGNNIAACGVPVVDTMGVRGGAIHSSDEFLITDSLSERARLAALTLMHIAQQGEI